MFKFLENFKKSEDGAITVDWVVLTAAVVGLGAGAVVGLNGETGTISDRTSEYMERQDPVAFRDIQGIYNAPTAGEDAGEEG